MLLQELINGLTLGVMYALLALGYSLIFGTLSFINFAHGPVAMVGAYVAWYGSVRMGMPFLLACLIGILCAGIVGVIMELVGYRPVRKSSALVMIIISVGFSYIIEVGLQIIFGTKAYDFSVKNVAVYKLGNVFVNSVGIEVLAVSLVLMVALQLFIHSTRAGRSIRAISLDRDTASLMGVNVNSTISLTFFIGSVLGSISVIMISIYYSQIYPTMGSAMGSKAFAAVVLGGVGSIPGAMVGGVLMGVIESFSATLFNPEVSQSLSFVVLILILIIRPFGLLGKAGVND